MSRCKSCTAEVFWARTASGNLMIPIDADPVEGGNIYVVTRHADGTPATVRVARQDELPHPYNDTYVSHFATCPDAREHRSKR